MKAIYIVIFFLTACSSPIEQDKEEVVMNKKESVIQDNVISYKLLYVEDVGWGYQIFRGKDMIINQKHIPAVQGIKGFKSEADADLVAKEVLKKVENGDDRPTLSKEFLDSLGVL